MIILSQSRNPQCGRLRRPEVWLISTKADLFASVISDRIGRFVLGVDLAALDGREVGARMDADGLRDADARTPNHRAHAPRHRRMPCFPRGRCRRLQERDPAHEPGHGGWVGLGRLCARGLICVDDPAEAVSMLRGMMTLEPQRAAMLGQRDPPGPAEINERAKHCARQSRFRASV